MKSHFDSDESAAEPNPTGNRPHFPPITDLSVVAEPAKAITMINAAAESQAWIVALACPHILRSSAIDPVSPKLRCLILHGLEASGGDIELGVQEFRKKTAYQTEVVAANGVTPVTVWADQRHRAAPRFVKTLWRQPGCGLVLASHYATARYQDGLAPEAALKRSLEALAKHFLANGANADEVAIPNHGSGPEIDREFDSIRNREFARALTLRKQRS